MAERKQSPPKQWRVIGALQASTGQVLQLADHIIGRRGVCDLLCQIHQAYKQVEKIYVIWDNWPVHAHKEVFDTLKLLPKIELVWLPTYAPWLNPIEKRVTANFAKTSCICIVLLMTGSSFNNVCRNSSRNSPLGPKTCCAMSG